MPESRRIVYWDSCVFLSYINDVADRIPILDALLASSASDSGTIKIYTSSLSRVEVSFGATEQKQQALETWPETPILSKRSFSQRRLSMVCWFSETFIIRHHAV